MMNDQEVAAIRQFLLTYFGANSIEIQPAKAGSEPVVTVFMPSGQQVQLRHRHPADNIRAFNSVID